MNMGHVSTRFKEYSIGIVCFEDSSKAVLTEEPQPRVGLVMQTERLEAYAVTVTLGLAKNMHDRHGMVR